MNKRIRSIFSFLYRWTTSTNKKSLTASLSHKSGPLGITLINTTYFCRWSVPWKVVRRSSRGMWTCRTTSGRSTPVWWRGGTGATSAEYPPPSSSGITRCVLCSITIHFFIQGWRSGFGQKPDPGLCTSNERRF